MVVDGKVEPIMAIHVDYIVIAGSDEACRDFHTASDTMFPTNKLGELTCILVVLSSVTGNWGR